MELILMGDSRLKVMLSAEEVRRFALDLEAGEMSGREAKAALRDLFDEIRRQSGFDAYSERLLVQLYPSKGGGCEIFMTKLGKRERETTGKGSVGEIGLAPELRAVLFRFQGIGDLLSVCRQLGRVGYDRLSTVYLADDDRYYLVLQEGARGGSRPSELAFVEEFGERRGGATALAYIKEHGRCLVSGDAVGRLAPLSL